LVTSAAPECNSAAVAVVALAAVLGVLGLCSERMREGERKLPT
jgi:hypothetical protein